MLLRQDPAALYTLFGERKGKGYINLGYWDPPVARLEEASDELVRQVGRLADLGPGDQVLDVGFGFGEQDLLWCREFQPARIVGLNITWLHTQTAARRVREEGMQEQILYQQGDATRLPFGDGSFDKVVALECAFHFSSRDDFFAEARRVLRPGGLLVTADVVRGASHGRPLARVGHSFFGFLHHRLWQIPRHNRYGIQEYRRRLQASGLRPEAVKDVTEQVFLPFAAQCLGKSYPDQPSFIQHLLKATRSFIESGSLRYIFTRSRKG